MSAGATAGRLRPGEAVVACRYCGHLGIEDGTDPAPGVCPPCLQRRSDPLVGELERRVGRDGPVAALHWLYGRWVEIGWSPRAAEATCRIQAALAGVDWEPRRC